MDRFLEKRELQEYMGQAQMMLLGAKEKAKGVLSSAQGLLPVDALSTVMFSPLAAHPVYRSESVLRAMQLQQSRQTSLPAHGAQNDALVAVGQTLAWPSSQALLAQSIPEETHPISLFQGFAATYPSLAGKPKKKKTRRKKVVEEMDETVPKTLKQLVHQREKKTRESDRVSMQKSSVVNEIEQLDFQINELLKKRKELENNWEILDKRNQELQLTIEGLDEAMMDIEGGGDGILPSLPTPDTESPMELYRRLFT